MPRYLKIFFSLTGTVLAALALFNLLIDPYNIYRVIQSPALDAAKLECSFLISRVAKTEMLRNSNCEVLVLGSSRAEVGIDPRSPAWQSEEVYNLGLSGTCIAEAAQVCRYAVHTKPLKRIVLLADFDNFADNAQRPKLEETRCNEQKDAVEYHLGKLLGLKTAKSSLSTWRRFRDGPESTTWTLHRGHLCAPLRDREWQDSFDHLTRQFLQQLYSRYVYTGRSMQPLAQIVADCRQSDVELTIVISPIHALHLETIHQAGLWPTFERWKRDLVETIGSDHDQHPGSRQVALWDFSGYSQYTCEAVPVPGDIETNMRWYLEWSHFTPALGDLVIARIMGRTSVDDYSLTDFGARIDRDNVTEHLATLRRQHDVFGDSHFADVTRVKHIAQELGISRR